MFPPRRADTKTSRVKCAWLVGRTTVMPMQLERDG